MTVLDYLAASRDRYPEKTALIDENRSVTYSELYDVSQRIGTALIEKTGKVNEPVIVLVDRNTESICTFFGIITSRNFYVPVDMGQPVQRIMNIIEHVDPCALVYTSELPEGLDVSSLKCPVLGYGELSEHDADSGLISEVRKDCRDTDPLYAICTSGSTGVPKIVVKSHLAALSYIPGFVKTFSLSEDDTFGNQSPFDFDVSAKDIYSTVYCGATMYIIPKVCFSMPKMLIDKLNEYKVTTIIWAVSALCIIAGIGAFMYKVPEYIKRVLFSGEVMPVKMLNIWRKYLPDAEYVNLYGPTEMIGNCLYYVIDKELENTDKLPLGSQFSNVGVLFLTADGKEMKPRDTGEIYIKGSCLALGYYREPEKTAQVFIQDPLNTRYPERVYRTGDLVTLSEDGEYYFAGRKDFQIKHMGHRIELEEIECYLNAVPEIVRASCLFDDKRNKIVAYYAGDIKAPDIVKALKQDLPKYMIPNVFRQADSLPISKNGKIDRQKIREMYFEG